MLGGRRRGERVEARERGRVAAVARRPRVEHRAAGDRRGRPQGADDDPVAAQRGERRLQPQLRTAGGAGRQPLAVEQHDARADGRRPVQDLDVRPGADAVRVRDGLQRDVEAVGRRQRRARRRGRRRAARRAARRRPGRPPRAGRRRASSTSASCSCSERMRASRPLGARRTRSPARSVPDQSVPVTTVPMPRRVKTRSTGSRARPPRGPRRQRRPPPRAAPPAARRARPRCARRPARTPRASSPAAAHRLLGVGRRQRGALLVHEVGLRQRDDQRPHPEQREDRQVLARLRHDAVVAGDAEQRQVDAGRAGDHRADEALVARHVDDRERAAPSPRSSTA